MRKNPAIPASPRVRAEWIATRRDALAGLGLLALGPLAAASAAEGEARPRAVPREGSAELLDEFLRMRTAPDGRPVLWIYSGVLVTKPEGEVARPLARIAGVSRTRADRRGDGGWDWHLDEAGYFCDLGTGAVLEEIRNPHTGAVVKPKHYRSRQHLVFAGLDVRPAAALPANIDFRGEITRLADVGAITAVTEDLYVRMPGRVAASLATFTATRAELSRPRSAWIDCQFAYTTLNSFVGWLGMQDVPGIQNMRLVGAKCRDDDQGAIPPWLRERIATEHGELLGAAK
jgi:hypothetical protein